MKSWKTTAGGLMLALGTAFTGMPNTQGWEHMAGTILGVVGAAFLGGSARDNNVTSEQAGAKK